MNTVYVVDAVRTPIGNFNGSLASLSAVQLGTLAIKALLNRNNIVSNVVSEVIMGQVLTANQGQNPARQSSIGADIPYHVPAYTINQVCGSGLQSIILGAQNIMNNNADIVIAGGQESMSNAPHASYLRKGIKMGNSNFVDTMIHDGLWDIFNNYHMGVTAENISKKFNISREEQDKFAYNSQQKATKAQTTGRFEQEIIPVKIVDKKQEINITQDEFIKPDSSLEKLAKLRPAFDKEGTVTAGNASGINDGAAAVILMSESALAKYKVNPIAKLVSFAHVGVDPRIMGIGPVFATKKALEKAQWTIKDLDLIEANEAFAAQAIAVNNEIGWNTKKVNVNGGAIAIGHPIGSSGARIFTTLLHEMKKQSAQKGIATLCVGGGMGVAACLELI